MRTVFKIELQTERARRIHNQHFEQLAREHDAGKLNAARYERLRMFAILQTLVDLGEIIATEEETQEGLEIEIEIKTK